jgi:LuxR family maltose regulon positive regulatory protein
MTLGPPAELGGSSALDDFVLDAEAPTVATKLIVPATPGYLIIRKRLLDVLDAGAQGPLVTVSAPAGAGKTILLATWIQTRRPPGPVAWLSLDADDNDASRLAADLLAALRAAGVIRRGTALHRLGPPRGARADAFLATLVNGLAKLRTDFVLALDDVHELTSPQATAMLDFLARHAPQQCHLVLSGRTDPPLAVERLRVSGALTELRGADLAFDREETGRLYRQLDLGLRDVDVDTLWRRTEGWAAALRLAGLSVQAHREPERFVAQLAGTDRAVADYLVAEVLTHAPAEQRAFMLRTCIVDSLTPGLGDALTGMEGSALILAALERSGAPVQQIHADGPAYRYHPLLRELLRAHLDHAYPEEVPLLHRRAAQWYAARGHTRAAIRHALAGESWQEAASMIEESWLELFISGASAAIRDPMDKLPVETVAAHPQLAAAFAGSKLEHGDLESADRYLSLAQRPSGGTHDGEQQDATLAAVALLRARLHLDADEARRRCEELMGLSRSPTDGWPRLRSFALSHLGATLLWTSGPRLAVPKLRKALALAGESGCEHVALDCQAQLALVSLLDGRLSEAEVAATAATALNERCGWDEGPGVACAYLVLGNVAYWRGEFEHAEGLASRAASAANAAELPVRIAVGLLQALALAAGGPRSATEGMLKLGAVRSAMADSDAVPELLSVALEDAEARVMLAAGQVEAARSVLSLARSRMDCPALTVRQAEVELRAGKPVLARSLLSAALNRSPASSPERAAWSATELEAWLLRALADEAEGDRKASAQALDRALEIAEQERLCGPFLAGGTAVRHLLDDHAQTGTDHPALLEALLAAAGPGAHHAEPPLAEPLTERELKILRYLPTMLSNTEIGAESFVSLNTVKTHLRSIYRKLDASNRADAVQRARALGLLPSGIRRPRVARRA